MLLTCSLGHIQTLTVTLASSIQMLKDDLAKGHAIGCPTAPSRKTVDCGMGYWQGNGRSQNICLKGTPGQPRDHNVLLQWSSRHSWLLVAHPLLCPCQWLTWYNPSGMQWQVCPWLTQLQENHQSLCSTLRSTTLHKLVQFEITSM